MRWLCNACGQRFAEPDYSTEGESISSTEKLGEVVKCKCPTCGSGNLVGAANPDPFKPKVVSRKTSRESIRAMLEYHGYKNIRFVNDQFCGIMRQIYTTAVFYGLDDSGNKGMIHFDTDQHAADFLATWDGATMPVVGAHGCKAVK